MSGLSLTGRERERWQAAELRSFRFPVMFETSKAGRRQGEDRFAEMAAKSCTERKGQGSVLLLFFFFFLFIYERKPYRVSTNRGIAESQRFDAPFRILEEGKADLTRAERVQSLVRRKMAKMSQTARPSNHVAKGDKADTLCACRLGEIDSRAAKLNFTVTKG